MHTECYTAINTATGAEHVFSRPRPKSIMKPNLETKPESHARFAAVPVAGGAEVLKIIRGVGSSIVRGLPQRLLPIGQATYVQMGLVGWMMRHNVLQVASTTFTIGGR